MTESIPTGRPRSEETRQRLLAAALTLLVERGYAGLSIEAVAAAAGSAKTTIYRWWPSKAELAVDAFFDGTEADLRLPNGGAARDDFRAQILDLAELLRGDRGRAFAEMLGGARSDAVLAKALGERWLAPRRRWGFERMQRAAAAGELRAGVAIGPALALLYAPLYTPLLFGEPLPNRDTVEATLALACSAIFV
ncbi:TetR-like C-terminal domain-containing protein [Sphingomonas sp. GlSt437]|uniref:TetR-like C-terminal domain-containing protein n=1 Tax=Sphingomonas sp. GlSt437 TaxID=3389970 RepID=UPI003A887740